MSLRPSSGQCSFPPFQAEHSLAYFTDEKGIYRLYLCERCRAYIKAVDLRHVKKEVSLPLERMLTLGIDSQAREKGYRPGYLDACLYSHPESS